MPTIVSHVAVPLALGIGIGSRRIPRRLLLAGVLASVLPDLDVVGFKLGIAYSDSFGHRGFSHSFLLALLVGMVAAGLARHLRAGRTVAFLFVAACAASHGLLDMFTDAGKGVAYAWPFSDERYFAPWRPIEASPLGLSRLLSPRGLEVFESELLWVWAPAVGLGLVLLAQRKTRC